MVNCVMLHKACMHQCNLRLVILNGDMQALPGKLTLHAADLTKEGSFDSILKVLAASCALLSRFAFQS